MKAIELISILQYFQEIEIVDDSEDRGYIPIFKGVKQDAITGMDEDLFSDLIHLCVDVVKVKNNVLEIVCSEGR